MSDMWEIIRIAVVSAILLGTVPIFLLYLVRRPTGRTRRLNELEACLERLETRAAQYERVT
jgi:hypothetical protein